MLNMKKQTNKQTNKQNTEFLLVGSRWKPRNQPLSSTIDDIPVKQVLVSKLLVVKITRIWIVVSIFRCFLKRFLLTLAQLSSSETLFLLKLSSVCNLSRRVHYFLNKHTWNLFRFDYLSRPLKAVILFVAVPMIFFRNAYAFIWPCLVYVFMRQDWCTMLIMW